MKHQETAAWKALFTKVKRHPVAVAIVVASSLAGAIAGVLAYYHGWLG